MRINKYLANSGACSRREADKLIKEGRVRINGEVALLGSIVSDSARVELDGKLIEPVKLKRYYVYNKPLGVICSTDQSLDNNIISVLNLPLRVFPVGRLDVNSSGLIFLTNDGAFANKVMHPSFEHEKEYEVFLKRPHDKDFFIKMSEGVHVLGKKLKPHSIKKLSKKAFSIVLKQGVNRQIRRMCETLGYEIDSLKRVRIMNIRLEDLAPGELKELKGSVLRHLLQNLGHDDI